MCEECLKEVEKDDKSILPIFTTENELGDEDENSPVGEGKKIKDSILAKKQEVEDSLTEFFKNVHDILYDIEGRKLQEVDEKIKEAFGRNLNFDELQRTIKVLKEKAEKVKKRVDKDEFQKIVSKKDEYQELINNSDNVIMDAQVYLEKTSSLQNDWGKEFINIPLTQYTEKICSPSVKATNPVMQRRELMGNIFGLDIALEKMVQEYIKLEK